MKKILIIDDEKPTRELIGKMIKSFGFDVEVYIDGENVVSGVEAIHRINPDLVFLDIQMSDGNGFDVLKSVNKIDFEVIFVTAFQEYAIQAIKFSALDYILKPIDAEELKLSLSKALSKINENSNDPVFQALQHNIQPQNKRKLVLKTQESNYVVDIEDIVRCESDKNYTFFYLQTGKKILVSRTLKEFDILLSPFDFFRVQQSHLINLNFVDRYDKHDGGSVIMKDGASIPLSPVKKDQFFKVLE
ncbi:MAG: response regulator transcription factor, partial [Bacteroidetes bacterium]|nr:response regulator transcription factor [Bacteroidota bacterium]